MFGQDPRIRPRSTAALRWPAFATRPSQRVARLAAGGRAEGCSVLPSTATSWKVVRFFEVRARPARIDNQSTL